MIVELCGLMGERCWGIISINECFIEYSCLTPYKLFERLVPNGSRINQSIKNTLVHHSLLKRHHEANHTPRRHKRLKPHFPVRRRVHSSEVVGVVGQIRHDALNPQWRKHPFNRHLLPRVRIVNHLHRHTPIRILKRTDRQRPHTRARTHPHSARLHEARKLREYPQAWRHEKIVADDFEESVVAEETSRCADPAEEGADVAGGEGGLDVVGPGQGFGGAAVEVEGLLALGG